MDENKSLFPKVSQTQRTFFVSRLTEWGKRHKRNFVWREHSQDFFVVFVAEFFLRRTRAESVDRLLRSQFLKTFHGFCDIAGADQKTLSSLLTPLGLHNQRARALLEISQILCVRESPPTPAEILRLPHCGRYIANAVACFYYRQRAPLVDRNVQRVFHRFFNLPVALEIHKADYLWEFAEGLLPQNAADFNSILLDFSALVCKPGKPRCDACPLKQKCPFYQ